MAESLGQVTDLCEGLSGVKGNFHAPFLGGHGAVMRLAYPALDPPFPSATDTRIFESKYRRFSKNIQQTLSHP